MGNKKSKADKKIMGSCSCDIVNKLPIYKRNFEQNI